MVQSENTVSWQRHHRKPFPRTTTDADLTDSLSEGGTPTSPTEARASAGDRNNARGSPRRVQQQDAVDKSRTLTSTSVSNSLLRRGALTARGCGNGVSL